MEIVSTRYLFSTLHADLLGNLSICEGRFCVCCKALLNCNSQHTAGVIKQMCSVHHARRPGTIQPQTHPFQRLSVRLSFNTKKTNTVIETENMSCLIAVKLQRWSVFMKLTSDVSKRTGLEIPEVALLHLLDSPQSNRDRLSAWTFLLCLHIKQEHHLCTERKKLYQQ